MAEVAAVIMGVAVAAAEWSHSGEEVVMCLLQVAVVPPQPLPVEPIYLIQEEQEEEEDIVEVVVAGTGAAVSVKGDTMDTVTVFRPPRHLVFHHPLSLHPLDPLYLHIPLDTRKNWSREAGVSCDSSHMLFRRPLDSR